LLGADIANTRSSYAYYVIFGAQHHRHAFGFLFSVSQSTAMSSAAGSAGMADISGEDLRVRFDARLMEQWKAVESVLANDDAMDDSSSDLELPAMSRYRVRGLHLRVVVRIVVFFWSSM